MARSIAKIGGAAGEFRRLNAIMDRLLSPGGCPWDRRQTHKTLLKHLREETREAEAAVKKKDWENLKEELGDILLQVVFHAALAKAKGRFNIAQVVAGINSKLIRRHPHVFGKEKLKTARQVVIQWNQIKKTEKRDKRSR